MLNQIPGIDAGTQLQSKIAHAASIVHGITGKTCPITRNPGLRLIACSLAAVYNACHSETSDAVRSCANKSMLRTKHSTESMLPCLTLHCQPRLPFCKPIVSRQPHAFLCNSLQMPFSTCLDPPYNAHISILPSLKMTSRQTQCIMLSGSMSTSKQKMYRLHSKASADEKLWA